MKLTATVKYLALDVRQATCTYTVRAGEGRVLERGVVASICMIVDRNRGKLTTANKTSIDDHVCLGASKGLDDSVFDALLAHFEDVMKACLQRRSLRSSRSFTERATKS